MPDDISRVTPDMGPCKGLSRRECRDWLAHTDEGRQWAAQHGRTQSMGQMAAVLANLSANAADKINAAAERRAAASNKQHSEAHTMGISTTLKALHGMDEHTFVKIVTRAASAQFPALSGPQAFTKLFTADDEAGRAIRAAHAITKGQVVGSDSPEREYLPARSRGVESGALSGREYAASDAALEDDAEDDRFDALAALEALAERERRRNPGMSKAIAFSKVYCDPNNTRLAQLERAQNRPRA
jgi:hypothetical protein